MEQVKIIIAGTGGTIAGQAASAADNVGYQAGVMRVADLLPALPRSAFGEQTPELVAVDLAQIDSKDMGPAVWSALVRSLRVWLSDPDVQAVVVTHGTDTIEETAWLLAALLPADKPVVLTCAMRPASALVPDGPQNLLDALTVARDPNTRGVCVVAAGWVHAAVGVQKVHPYRLDAFSSGDEGALGCVEEGCVRWFKNFKSNEHLPLYLNKELALEFVCQTSQAWPRVELVFSYAGVGPDSVDVLCAPRDGVAPVRGLVVAGTGNGTIHADLEPALRRAQAAGVLVWRCSRCAWGRVVVAESAKGARSAAGKIQNQSDQVPLGGVPGHWPVVALSAFKARLALVLHLMSR